MSLKNRFLSDQNLNFIPLLIFSIYLLPVISCSTQKQSPEGPRFVITSPEVAEIIADIQGLDNIVGVTIECDYPPELQNKPKVGTFGKVDIEKVIELEPTIIFTAGLEQENLAFEFQKLSIQTAPIYPKSIKEMIASIKAIGIIIEEEERANLLADSLAAIFDTFQKFETDKKPSVYVEIYGSPIMSVSDRSFIGEIVEIAGGDNIFSELPRDYSRIKSEDVITKNPEIIILTYPGIKASNIKERMGWEIISACKNNRIYTTEDINPDLILRASPRVVQGVKQLRKVFYE